MKPDPSHGNVLVLVDEDDAGEQIAQLVAATGERPTIAHWDSPLPPDSGAEFPVDLIVTDRSLDDPDSLAVLRSLHSGELLPHAPRLHLLRDEAAREDLRLAGPDGVSLAMAFPPDPTEFKVRIRLAAEVGRLRREIERSAILDPHTGLNNRAFLLRRLGEELARARRHRTPLSLVLFDVDRLRRINDAFGYNTGDSVVQQFAQIIRVQVRTEDILGRLAGATLAVVMPGNGVRGAATFANKVRTDTEDVLLRHGEEIYPVHVSAGITTYPDASGLESADAMVRAAEAALAEAKARGGNRVFIDANALRRERPLVLVADPDPELVDLAEDFLTLDDYEVVRAESARTALEVLRSRRPDLVVLDLHMAESEDDTPLIERIRSLYPAGRFPIIGLSRDTGIVPEHLARLGVERFITKPFSVSLLRGAAREVLEEARIP